MSQIMFAMIKQIIATQPDLTIASRLSGPSSTTAQRFTNIDVVIAGNAVPEASIDRLRQDRPRKLLTVGENGQHGILWVLRPYRTNIAELSADTLLAAIREDV
jgi:hypothetical protein